MRTYRTRIEVILDILGVVEGGAKKTCIMYQASLSYKMLMRYLKDLSDLRLLKLEGRSYTLTDKSREFLGKLKDLERRKGKLVSKIEEKVRKEKSELEGVESELTSLYDQYLT